MRVAVLSDLHIGARPDRAGFGHDPLAFVAWLAGIEAEHDHVVLAGDIYQTDHTLWPSKRSLLREYHAARSASPVLAEHFANAAYRYIHGNHDAIAAHTGVPDRLMLHHGSVALLVTHGDAFDPIAKHTPWAAALGTYATAALRLGGLTSFAAALERRDVALKHARFGGCDGPYARGAARLARDAGARVVVIGHTHAAEAFVIDGEIVYANCGTCSGGRREYVSIDLGAGWLETRRAAADETEIVRRVRIPERGET